MMKKNICSLVFLWGLYCNVKFILCILFEYNFVVSIFTVCERTFKHYGKSILIGIQTENSLDFAYFFNIVLNVKETVTISLDRCFGLHQDQEMLHFSNKDRLSIKIDSKYFFPIMYLNFPNSNVSFLKKLKPSKPDPIIKMIKLIHSIEFTIEQEIQTNNQSNRNKEQISFGERHLSR